MVILTVANQQLQLPLKMEAIRPPTPHLDKEEESWVDLAISSSSSPNRDRLFLAKEQVLELQLHSLLDRDLFHSKETTIMVDNHKTNKHMIPRQCAQLEMLRQQKKLEERD